MMILQPSPPPILVTRIGIVGILSCWASWGLIGLFVTLAIDQFIANGALVLMRLPAIINDLFSVTG